jgi:hypothetical protein
MNKRDQKILYVALNLLLFVLPEPIVMKIFEILNGCLTYLICELDEFFCKELLSSVCGLMKPRHGRDKARGAEKSNDEAEKDQTEAKVAFDCPWMCRGGLQA